MQEMIIEARGIRKIYEMGELKVHALQGVDLWGRRPCLGRRRCLVACPKAEGHARGGDAHGGQGHPPSARRKGRA